MRVVGGVLIGVACALLQPDQPESLVATALLILAMYCWLASTKQP
jgi:hypothetical protein